jgi:large subunit ribosomal protein L21e
MPFKWYHGKTGLVWTISKRAIGVEINKQASSAHGEDDLA